MSDGLGFAIGWTMGLAIRIFAHPFRRVTSNQVSAVFDAFRWLVLILFWIISAPLWLSLAIFGGRTRFSADTSRLQRTPCTKR